MGMIGVNHSTKMAVLGSSFQYVDNKYMSAEALEEYVLASAEAAYQDPGQHVPMVFMASEGESLKTGNTSHWLDQKHPSFNILN